MVIPFSTWNAVLEKLETLLPIVSLLDERKYSGVTEISRAQ